jgi:hypothetical protein
MHQALAHTNRDHWQNNTTQSLMAMAPPLRLFFEAL